MPSFYSINRCSNDYTDKRDVLLELLFRKGYWRTSIIWWSCLSGMQGKILYKLLPQTYPNQSKVLNWKNSNWKKTCKQSCMCYDGSRGGSLGSATVCGSMRGMIGWVEYMAFRASLLLVRLTVRGLCCSRQTRAAGIWFCSVTACIDNFVNVICLS